MGIFKQIFFQLSELGNFWQRPTNRRLFLFSSLFIIFQIIVIVFYIDNLPPQLPLFYSLPWGQDQLVSPKYLYLLPLTSLLVLLCDVFFILFLAKQKLLSLVLLISSLSFCFLSTFTLIKIINLIS